MASSRNKGRKPVWGLFILMTFIVLGFQNCGDLAQQSLFDQNGSTPFPYKVAIDQVAYMSCAEQGNVVNERGVYFTLRAGAYIPQTGLGLSDGFRALHASKKPERVLDLLADDGASTATRVQFSVRRENNLSSLFINSSAGTGIEGIDYDFVFGSLGRDEMSASLLTLPNQQEYMNYWAAGGLSVDARMQGNLEFNGSEALAQSFRDFLMSDGIFVVGFSEDVEPANIRTPASVIDEDTGQQLVTRGNVAYGKGYKLSFKQPDPLNWGHSGLPHFGMPKRVLASVTEQNLEVPGRSVGLWECPTELQLRIAFPEDIEGNNPAACRKVSDKVGSPEIEFIRRSLPKSDWWVDIDNRCVIPKKFTTGSCYGIDAGTQNTRRIEYDFTRACDPTLSITCAHFVSICLKTQ